MWTEDIPWENEQERKAPETDSLITMGIDLGQ